MASVRLSGQRTRHTELILIGIIALFTWYSTVGRESLLSFIGGLSFSHEAVIPAVKTPTTVVQQENLTVATVKRVSPSVVTVVGKLTRNENLNTLALPKDDPNNGSSLSSVSGVSPDIVGSGFIVSSDGLIVTGKHVISETKATYSVVTSDGDVYTIDKVYRDPDTDIAILKITPKKSLTPLLLGDSSDISVGENVISIGTALGDLQNTVTTGIISGLDRKIAAGDETEVENLSHLIQTSAAINPGSSGGPLMDDQGRVIGINIALAASAQNINFAVPINAAKATLAAYKLGL